MKMQILSRLRSGAAILGLLAGLGYSIFVFASPAASAHPQVLCKNCAEEEQDARAFCQGKFGDPGLYEFQCPANVHLDPARYAVICEGDPEHGTWYEDCDN